MGCFEHKCVYYRIREFKICEDHVFTITFKTEWDPRDLS